MKLLQFTLLTLCGVAVAQEVKTTQLSDITPLAYVVNLEPLEGKSLMLKNVVCQAENKPNAQGRLYLRHIGGNQLQVARLEYNEQGRVVLDQGRNAPNVYKYFDRYVTQQQPFSLFTMNTLIGLWKMFGMRFSLENVQYHCQMS